MRIRLTVELDVEHMMDEFSDSEIAQTIYDEYISVVPLSHSLEQLRLETRSNSKDPLTPEENKIICAAKEHHRTWANITNPKNLYYLIEKQDYDTIGTSYDKDSD